LTTYKISPEEVLKEYFGYDRFRPMQRDIIEAVLQKKDVLVLMPTGGGKSVCYQVPAMVMPGTCVVISPLIALMKDQVGALKVNGIEAGFINSSQNSREQSEIEKKCLDGKLKLLYVSPEKLFTEGFQWLLSRIKINLFAIDEAHCISFWGHDFRPEYTQLKIIKAQYPDVPVIALTATADKLTRKDIVQQLQLPDPEIFIASFDRPNLRLNVLPGLKRMERITNFLDSHEGQPGIIYCLSRKTTETTAEKLREKGYIASPYHAGLPADLRARTQEAFLKDDVQIICATIAFGMGIDKSNVRWVIHYNLPKNIESYYQEIGRSGRDGAPAEALLCYTYSDVAMQQEMLKESSPEHRELQEAKLERLKQYAETLFCRRKVLLNYFNEGFEHDCGNCDNCARPRKMSDGTLIAQKALSAIARMDEKAGVNVLIDVLRGSRTQAVMSRNFQEIKTFGAGREIKPLEWRDYIQQMINLGIMDIAYDESHYLKLTERSKKVLFEGEKVSLADPVLNYQKQALEPEEEKLRSRPKKEIIEVELFERLRRLRKNIADRDGLPPYIVFNDNTLREMATEKPTTKTAMLEVSGVGLNKYQSYGEAFIEEIISFVNAHTEQGNRIKGATHLVTYESLRRDYSPEDIAKQRNLNIVTIYSHIATLYEGGYPIELDKYLSASELQAVLNASRTLGPKAGMKEILDFLEGEINYGKIRMGLAYAAKKG
jgi:ATP-dependent DNA helicase RecQ